MPFIDSVDKAEDAVEKINKAGESAALRPLIFSTLVQDEYRSIVRTANGLYLDIFDAFLTPLEMELDVKSSAEPGRAHGMSDVEAYMKRIEATNFALANDDGGVSPKLRYGRCHSSRRVSRSGQDTYLSLPRAAVRRLRGRTFR